MAAGSFSVVDICGYIFKCMCLISATLRILLGKDFCDGGGGVTRRDRREIMGCGGWVVW